MHRHLDLHASEGVGLKHRHGGGPIGSAFRGLGSSCRGGGGGRAWWGDASPEQHRVWQRVKTAAKQQGKPSFFERFRGPILIRGCICVEISGAGMQAQRGWSRGLSAPSTRTFPLHAETPTLWALGPLAGNLSRNSS